MRVFRITSDNKHHRLFPSFPLGVGVRLEKTTPRAAEGDHTELGLALGLDPPPALPEWSEDKCGSLVAAVGVVEHEALIHRAAALRAFTPLARHQAALPACTGSHVTSAVIELAM